MSRLYDALNYYSYMNQVVTGKISPLRLANDAVIKPLVYGLSRKFGANENEIQVADELFEGIYSFVHLDPLAAINNWARAYEDYKFFKGNAKEKSQIQTIKTMEPTPARAYQIVGDALKKVTGTTKKSPEEEVRDLDRRQFNSLSDKAKTELLSNTIESVDPKTKQLYIEGTALTKHAQNQKEMEERLSKFDQALKTRKQQETT